MNQNTVKTPIHLWIVGVLALLWNSGGAFDYVATQMQIESYMAAFTPEQLDYFYGFPAWMDAAWAIGVWGSVLGCLGLLLRKAWAKWMFAAALLGLAVSTVYNLTSGGFDIMGQQGAIFTGVIWLFAILLFLYAHAMSKRGVLK